MGGNEGGILVAGHGESLRSSSPPPHAGGGERRREHETSGTPFTARASTSSSMSTMSLSGFDSASDTNTKIRRTLENIKNFRVHDQATIGLAMKGYEATGPLHPEKSLK